MNNNELLKGVSTLDFLKVNFKLFLIFTILASLSGAIYGGHSILDLVDPGFNPDIQTNSYGAKFIDQVQTTPDGKILVFGKFTSYNRVPVGKLVRLNADGSLDTTFNNQTITSISGGTHKELLVQPDGKIILMFPSIVADGQPPKSLIRLNSDGTLDSGFNYSLGGSLSNISLDSLGRIAVRGLVATPQGDRFLFRLNPDGSFDNSFNFSTPGGVTTMTSQGNKLIVCYSSNGYKIFRLNDNGSLDSSFTTTNLYYTTSMIVQPDNKILVESDGIRRINSDGGIDAGFQLPNLTGFGGQPLIRLVADGKIVAAPWASNAFFRRFLPNGATDTSFNQFTHPAFTDYDVYPDGSVIVGDFLNQNVNVGINNFIRLVDGVPDPNFNAGGIGFQIIQPGSIRTIDAQPDGKILLGGKFDVVNDIPRSKIARLNADSTLDDSFQINISGAANTFSLVQDIYQIRRQSDGKIIVSGYFDYNLGGTAKKNLVRLNSDGSIDTTFDLTEIINDYSVVNNAGRNRFDFTDGNKLIIGNSKIGGSQPVPLKLNESGNRDITFNSPFGIQTIYVDDLVIQSDGKIIVAGSYTASGPLTSFVVRLNADGTMDSSFAYPEATGRLKATLALLPNGKILIGRHSGGITPGTVQRLNADGSLDSSFNSLTISNGIINALLTLPNGKILVGGKFAITVNGQQVLNLLQLNENGSFAATTYGLNEEVLCLAVDGEGRVLVGGNFTVIGANGGTGASRSYVARLTDSNTKFDFDGDGRSDVSVFRASEGNWYINRSSAGFTAMTFGLSSDTVVPADYDGDGKTDIAVFRNGYWYISKSTTGFAAVHFGESTDIPQPADYDADGRDDLAVFRPSNGTWYVLGSRNGFFAMQFGANGDKPLAADYDGDGRADFAVFRDGYWFIQNTTAGYKATPFGFGTDIPIPADYDGDGKTDIAVFRDGFWYILQSSGGLRGLQFGNPTDMPIPADYDGDGKVDITVFRSGNWYMLKSSNGSFYGEIFGYSTDKPIPSALR